jgi:transcriptional regulator with XRE-family HTH domain
MRKQAGMSAANAAGALNTTVQTIFNWESGLYNPKASKLLDIANLYGCTIEELLAPDEPEVRPRK